MALFLQHQGEDCHWAVWKLEETLEELLSLLPDSRKYRQEVEKFSSAHRRLEWCAVRVLLYTILGVEKEIRYQDSGKPYLADKSFSLSISHTKGYVAVILGDINKEVGIDIEQYGERVRKVAHKFVRDDELPGAYEGTDTWGMLLHWSAKIVWIFVSIYIYVRLLFVLKGHLDSLNIEQLNVVISRYIIVCSQILF